MKLSEWRALGIFAAVLIALSFVDGRLAWYLIGAFAAIVLIRNAGKISTFTNTIQG